MQSFIAWLLGVDTEGLGPDAEIGFRLNQMPEGWQVFLLAVAVIAFTVWIYRRDGKDTAGWPLRFTLGVIRAMLLIIALLILTEPILVSTHTEKKRSTVLVLLDDSFSMSLKFPYAEDALRDQIKKALGPDQEIVLVDEQSKQQRKLKVKDLELADFGKITRMQVACQALRKNDLLGELEKKHDVKLYTYSKSFEPLPGAEGRAPKLETEPEARGSETRIGDALRQAMKEHRGLPLAGVIVIGDGRQTAGEDAVQVVASQYKIQRIPVFTVAVGDPGEPKDIELSVEGPDVILPDDPSEIVAYVRQRGYDSLGTLRIEMRRENGEVVGQPEEVKLGKSGEKVPIPLKFREKTAGKYVYTIKLPEQDGELRPENNVATHTFQVVDKKVKVLFVEGQEPRWEYRYLKTYLIRDHTTEADILFATTDGAWIWDGTASKEPLERFPGTKKEMNEYDVLILGDVNPIIFTNDQTTLIRDFVREGGGFIMIAGERFAPAAYTGGPLGEMLPVVPQRAAYAIGDEGLQETFPLELTNEGRRMPWTHLDADEGANREIWENLPRLFWYYPVKRVKELATPVVVHPYDKDEQGKKMPLVSVMPYGAGRSMFIGVDSLWRWRRGIGDRYHYRFYNQAIRFLSMAKRLGGQKRFLMDVDKVSYAIGDKVVVNALLKDEKFEPLTVPTTTLHIETAKGERKTEELTHRKESGGSYEGHFFPTEEGDYTVWLVDPNQPEVRQSEVTFKVDVPQLELENPRTNEELLRALADAGGEGGQFIAIDKLDTLPPLIREKTDLIQREIPTNLWDRWPVLALFTALITAEWLLRKRGRMM
ncbi:MAG: hypothetical protein AMXMBFR7_13000 [Planctomycetota bacterium]